MSEEGGDWRQSALADFARWLDELGDDVPDAGRRPKRPQTRPQRTPDARNRPDAICAICTTCSPSSPRCVRRSACRTASSPGRAGSLRRRRPDTTTPRIGCGATKATWPHSSSGSPGRPRTGACGPSWRCGTPWREAGRRRSRCASGPPGCSGARREASRGSRKATRWRSGASTGCCPGSGYGVCKPWAAPSTPEHARDGDPPGRSVADGVVVEELLDGFTRDDDVLRLADVAVNCIDTQE